MQKSKSPRNSKALYASPEEQRRLWLRMSPEEQRTYRTRVRERHAAETNLGDTNVPRRVARNRPLGLLAQADDVLIGKDFALEFRKLLPVRQAVRQRLIEFAARKSRAALGQDRHDRRAVPGLDRVQNFMLLLAVRVLRTLPALALPLQTPRLALGVDLKIRKGFARRRVDPAGDDVHMPVRRVAVRDKNRPRVFHADAFQEALRRFRHFLAAGLLPLLP